jgi:hypothetical protein
LVFENRNSVAFRLPKKVATDSTDFHGFFHRSPIAGRSRRPDGEAEAGMLGQAPNAVGRPPSFVRSLNPCHPGIGGVFAFYRKSIDARKEEVSGEPLRQLRGRSLETETFGYAPWVNQW